MAFLPAIDLKYAKLSKFQYYKNYAKLKLKNEF